MFTHLRKLYLNLSHKVKKQPLIIGIITMKTLILETKRIREEHGTAARYAREHNGDPKDLTGLYTWINRNADLIPHLIRDGYLSIQEVDEAEFTQKAKSA